VDALAVISDALLSVAAERDPAKLLQRLVEAARGVVDATYAAVGIPAEDDPEVFEAFLYAGMDAALVEQLGDLPRSHGMLGAMLVGAAPYRTDDITADPRFRGWWPSAHPRMRSFLGVPIVYRGDVLGAFYLTDKLPGQGRDTGFTAADQRLIEVLAAHAAIALTNARLYDASRELAVAEERERLARELHDALSQTLFSLSLTAKAAAAALPDDPMTARERLDDVGELARGARAEVRSLVQGLRPADLAADGVLGALERHLTLLRRVHEVALELHDDGWVPAGDDAELQVFRIVQEAVSNALRHAGASRIDVRLGPGCAEVCDDGRGFEPTDQTLRARHLGLTTMRDRAEEAGGTLEVHAAPGAGTTVTVRLG